MSGRYRYLVVSFLILTLGIVVTSMAGNGPPSPPVIWADGMLYRTVDTGNSLPDKGPKDGLFVFIGPPEGQRPVAESKPGDQDYNGGRWQVILVAFTKAGALAHDPLGDGIVDFELQDWETVEAHIAIGHLKVIGPGPSFVCPLIKAKAKRR